METNNLPSSNSIGNVCYTEGGLISCPNCSQVLTHEEYEFHLNNCMPEHNDSVISTERQKVYVSLNTESDLRVTCKFCDRKFAPERVLKHQFACEYSSKKRPQFDMKRKRSPLLESDTSKVMHNSKRHTLTQKFNDKKWHKLHEDFLNTIRYARKFKSFEEKGKDPTVLKPPAALYDNYIQCPTCLRKFAPIPGERHIANCKNIINKPKPLARMPTDMHFPQIKNNGKSYHNKQIKSLNNSTVKEDSQCSYYCSPTMSKKEIIPNKSPIPPIVRVSPDSSDPYTIKTRRRDSSVQRSAVFAIQCSHCSKVFDPKGLEKHIQTYSKELAKTKQFRVMSESPYPKYSPIAAKNSQTDTSTLRIRRSGKALKHLDEKCKNCKSPCPFEAKFCMMCGMKLDDS
ncbi:unnamed protein product [Blepharisma stoltei]|uniref:Uncharacterized protein n=1 Tax=Blepharisma stoltei TaxID=1481888 RepID=A0AAU9IVW7_9CILI|nr:unnamed protein product [Blepharisma stoltei]